jgi:hypothetical protein
MEQFAHEACGAPLNEGPVLFCAAVWPGTTELGDGERGLFTDGGGSATRATTVATKSFGMWSYRGLNLADKVLDQNVCRSAGSWIHMELLHVRCPR